MELLAFVEGLAKQRTLSFSNYFVGDKKKTRMTKYSFTSDNYLTNETESERPDLQNIVNPWQEYNFQFLLKSKKVLFIIMVYKGYFIN